MCDILPLDILSIISQQVADKNICDYANLMLSCKNFYFALSDGQKNRIKEKYIKPYLVDGGKHGYSVVSWTYKNQFHGEYTLSRFGKVVEHGWYYKGKQVGLWTSYYEGSDSISEEIVYERKGNGYSYKKYIPYSMEIYQTGQTDLNGKNHGWWITYKNNFPIEKRLFEHGIEKEKFEIKYIE